MISIVNFGNIVALQKERIQYYLFTHTKHFLLEFFRQNVQLIQIPTQPFLSLNVTAKVEIQKHKDLYFRKMLAYFYKQGLIELSSTRTPENFISEESTETDTQGGEILRVKPHFSKVSDKD